MRLRQSLACYIHTSLVRTQAPRHPARLEGFLRYLHIHSGPALTHLYMGFLTACVISCHNTLLLSRVGADKLCVQFAGSCFPGSSGRDCCLCCLPNVKRHCYTQCHLSSSLDALLAELGHDTQPLLTGNIWRRNLLFTATLFIKSQHNCLCGLTCSHGHNSSTDVAAGGAFVGQATREPLLCLPCPCGGDSPHPVCGSSAGIHDGLGGVHSHCPDLCPHLHGSWHL